MRIASRLPAVILALAHVRIALYSGAVMPARLSRLP